MAQDVHVVVPELILDEERHHRSDGTQETACVAHRVERQVTHDVGSLVVLTHLIARGREERKQNFILGELVAYVSTTMLSLYLSVLRLMSAVLRWKSELLTKGGRLMAPDSSCLTRESWWK